MILLELELTPIFNYAFDGNKQRASIPAFVADLRKSPYATPSATSPSSLAIGMVDPLPRADAALLPNLCIPSVVLTMRSGH